MNKSVVLSLTDEELQDLYRVLIDVPGAGIAEVSGKL